MPEITAVEAFDRMNRGEIVERYFQFDGAWRKCKKVIENNQESIVWWCKSVKKWTTPKPDFWLIHFCVKGNYRTPEPEWKEVPWYEAVEWMNNNRDNECQSCHKDCETRWAIPLAHVWSKTTTTYDFPQWYFNHVFRIPV
jgi:hypothetical protein